MFTRTKRRIAKNSIGIRNTHQEYSHTNHGLLKITSLGRRFQRQKDIVLFNLPESTRFGVELALAAN